MKCLGQLTLGGQALVCLQPAGLDLGRQCILDLKIERVRGFALQLHKRLCMPTGLYHRVQSSTPEGHCQ